MNDRKARKVGCETANGKQYCRDCQLKGTHNCADFIRHADANVMWKKPIEQIYSENAANPVLFRQVVQSQ